MILSLIRNWWAIGIVGALAVIVGLMAFAMPIATLASLVLVFGSYALVSGIFQVVAGATGETEGLAGSRTWIIVAGALSIAAGLITLFWPGLTAVTLYTLVAAWAIVAGIAQAVSAIAHRKTLEHTWLVALGGGLMVIFGVYLLATPAGVLALAYAFGTFALAYGVSMLVASYQLKRAHDRVEVFMTRERHPAELREREDELTRR